MTCSFHDKPDIVCSREFDALLHLLAGRGIDYIDWIAFSSARRAIVWQAGIIAPVIPGITDRIGLVKEDCVPRCLHGRAYSRIV